jgi:hypothetical protein
MFRRITLTQRILIGRINLDKVALYCGYLVLLVGNVCAASNRCNAVYAVAVFDHGPEQAGRAVTVAGNISWQFGDVDGAASHEQVDDNCDKH